LQDQQRDKTQLLNDKIQTMHIKKTYSAFEM